MSLNNELAKLFNTMATVLEIKGENAFKVNANRKVARELDELIEDIESIQKISDIKGIGKSSAIKIKTYIETGTMEGYAELINSIPSGLLELMTVQGLGPKTVGRLWKEIDVVDIATLKNAIEDGRLESMPRMGKKTIQNIAESIDFLKHHAGRWRIGVAMPLAEEIVQKIKSISGVTNVKYAGSLRRGKETIGDIDILVSAMDEQLVAESFCNLENVEKVLAKGTTKCSIRVTEGLQIDLRIVPEESFGAALMYFTGGKEHNIILRERAIKQNKKLNEYGLTPSKICDTEENIYKDLGLPWIPPEIREDRGEIECKLTPRLIQLNDIRCDLHCHTTASDGHMSIQQLAEEAIARGFHSIAVTDHSQSQGQANGLSPERLRAHIDAIKKIDQKYNNIQILAGSEVDILPDGTLDYEDELLNELDIVVASPHASLQQNKSDATARLIRAIEHPLVNIIGHPTGRIINKRKGLEPDIPSLIDAAHANNTALEINANSYRLDLRDSHVRAACNGNAMISINTDAHRPGDFNQLIYGILTARRGWALPSNCVNCMELAELQTWLALNC